MRPHLVPGLRIGRDDRNQHQDAVPGQQFGHETDAVDMGVAVDAAETEPGRKMGADFVTVQHFDVDPGGA